MIGSTSNKQVKRVVNLRAKAKARREENCYVAEGLRMCRELSPDQVEMLYVTEEFGSVPGNRRWLAGFPHETVSDVVMNYMADTKTPQGVLAVVIALSQHRLCSSLAGREKRNMEKGE